MRTSSIPKQRERKKRPADAKGTRNAADDDGLRQKPVNGCAGAALCSEACRVWREASAQGVRLARGESARPWEQSIALRGSHFPECSIALSDGDTREPKQTDAYSSKRRRLCYGSVFYGEKTVTTLNLSRPVAGGLKLSPGLLTRPDASH